MTQTAVIRGRWRGTDGFVLLLTTELALLAGGLLARTEGRAPLLAAAIGFAALVVLTFEVPIVTFGLIGLLLALAPGDAVDSLAPELTSRFYGGHLPYVLVSVLLLALAVGHSDGQAWWPGPPATVAITLAMIGIVTSLRFGPPKEALFVTRPIFLLAASVFVGYWLAQRYGPQLPLRILVAAGMLSVPLGLYNTISGHELSFYDSSCVFLLGVVATLVLFSAVNIGVLKIPFLLLSAIVIVFSLRRATMIAIMITILIAGLVKGGGGFRGVALVGAGALTAAEIVVPGSVFDNLAHLVGYFSGASGTDFSVNYRKYETANVWLNVKAHWLNGIGPVADWRVFTTFEGRFRRITEGYAHNSYLWVWLRYGLVGLALYIAFFVSSAATLIRRSAPIESVIVGGSIVGLAFAVATASFLTTTVRWPLIVGLLVGIALQSRRDATELAAA
jgi:O-Antigen ligase